ncbi:hypothetical protein NM688_g4489 [Phlebia brevispora]|uniref:Uncharacterized protein n=1 Tax=Phlebia brevispora TaxID=194682 RepID=A0ACC1T2X9_9APHY|nr:hypothetical protein NM688_g4489 [Phlebia brevispora]
MASSTPPESNAPSARSNPPLTAPDPLAVSTDGLITFLQSPAYLEAMEAANKKRKRGSNHRSTTGKFVGALLASDTTVRQVLAAWDRAARSSEERERHLAAFKTTLSRIPRRQETFTNAVKNGQFLAIERLTGLMNDAARQCRSDDSSGLKTVGIQYLLCQLPASKFTAAQLEEVLLTPKPLRSWNNNFFGQLLCPHHLSEDYSHNSSAFRECAYNTEAIDEGLLRGPCLVKVYKHMFTAPQSAQGGEFRRTGQKNQAELQAMLRTTPQSIAYACVQTHHMLCTSRDSMKFDGAFDNEKFFRNVVDLFDYDPNSKWAVETLEWWDMQVFRKGPCGLQPSTVVNRAASSSTDIDRLKEQRDAWHTCQQAPVAREEDE